MRLLSGLAAAACLALPAVPVFAKNVAVDVAMVETCFEDSNDSVDPACIGAAANACQALPGGAGTLGVTECLAAETKVWDRLLNLGFQEVKAGKGAEIQAHLVSAQRAWIALRDADCAFASAVYGEGSMRHIAAASCEMNHTARRALELRQMSHEGSQ